MNDLLNENKIKSINIYISEQMYSNDNYFEKYDKKWYIHPLFKSFASSEDGYIIYKNKKILKPRLKKNELYIRINKLKWYPIKRLVYECIHNIDEVPLIKHVDGNKINNCIGNLQLLHIRYV